MLAHESLDLGSDDGVPLILVCRRRGIVLDGAHFWRREDQLVAVKLEDLQAVDFAETHGELLDLVLGNGQHFQRGQVCDFGGDGPDLVPADIENLQRSHLKDLAGESALDLHVTQRGGARTASGISRMAL